MMGDKCRQIFNVHDAMLNHHYCLFRLDFYEFQLKQFVNLVIFFDLLKFLILCNILLLPLYYIKSHLYKSHNDLDVACNFNILLEYEFLYCKFDKINIFPFKYKCKFRSLLN
jgi:hypothetical protein